MCLTASALSLFLSMMPQERITRSEDRIVFAAEVRDAVWTRHGSHWCTGAKRLDAVLRLGVGEAA
ncbi:hypothetical protein [Pseudooceanicola sp.]|jgi:hypothetical protein|uniref:hypothetical protein n=1 Tax=Pseudooceanicola sp. TaxID=1914328 RepID=UPI00405A2B39